MSHHTIAHTQNWVSSIIVKYNFCPFARKELEQNTLHYVVSHTLLIEDALEQLINECTVLDQDSEKETTLLIFDQGFTDFDEFIDLIELANHLMQVQGYEGVYQLAHFHPEYCFADCAPDDAQNFTNRSPYPTLHLIREKSVENALKSYPDPEMIPENNIKLTERKGADFWRTLLQQCLDNSASR